MLPFLEQLDCRENFLISLGRSHTLTRGLPKQRDESMQQAFIRWREKHSIQAENGEQSIVKNKHKSQRKLERHLSAPSLALLPFHLARFFTPWLHFSSRPGENHFPFSHMNIHKSHHHTEHTAGVFVGDFWSSLALSCTALTQLQKTMGFQRGIVYLCKWTHKDGPSPFASLACNTVSTENKACNHVNRPFGARIPIFALSILTHCLGPLPLKQTTKAHCEELTPY